MTKNTPAYAGLDCAWVAVDGTSHVAVFIVAGQGAIPQTAIESTPIDPTDLEEAILTLPVSSNATAASIPGNLDSYVQLARRGFFVYDWQDIHRTHGTATHSYEVVAAPSLPIKIDLLPDLLRTCALATTFKNIQFASLTAISRGMIRIMGDQ